jgi:ankyrin repeat protein
MISFLKVLGVSVVLVTAIPQAGAQTATGSIGYQFVEAVRDRELNKMLDIVRSNGAAMINFRNDRGESAMHLVTSQRNGDWLGYFLSQGGDANLPDRNGDTPLHVAARSGWSDGMELLLRRRARVDAANKLGETPLIVAVQGRQLAAVRRLLEAGANPAKPDNASGRSARDYAKLDTRSGREILSLMDSIKPRAAAAVAGPKL